MEENINEKENEEEIPQETVPEEFSKIIKDFYKDVLLVFPDFSFNSEFGF